MCLAVARSRSRSLGPILWKGVVKMSLVHLHVFKFKTVSQSPALDCALSVVTALFQLHCKEALCSLFLDDDDDIVANMVGLRE